MLDWAQATNEANKWQPSTTAGEQLNNLGLRHGSKWPALEFMAYRETTRSKSSVKTNQNFKLHRGEGLRRDFARESVD